MEADTIERRLSPFAERELRRALRRNRVAPGDAELILLSLAQMLEIQGKRMVLSRTDNQHQ